MMNHANTMHRRQQRISIAFILVLTLSLFILAPVFFFVIGNTVAGIGASLGLLFNVVSLILVLRGMRTFGNALFLSVDLLLVIAVAFATAGLGTEYAAVAVSLLGLSMVVLIPSGLLVSLRYSAIATVITAAAFSGAIYYSGVPMLISRIPIFAVILLVAGGTVVSISSIQDRLTEELDQQGAAQREMVQRLESVLDRVRDLRGESATDQSELSLELRRISEIFEAYRSGVEDLHRNSLQMREQSADADSGFERLDEAMSRIAGESSAQAQVVETHALSQQQLLESMSAVSADVRTVEAALERLTDSVSTGGSHITFAVQQMQDVSAQRGRLQESIELIKRIVAQTNLLAMNASIEAAHAGDAGRGFAVVANEVRSLADEAAIHAASITDVVKSMNSAVEGGAARVSQAGSVFHAIDSVVRDSAPAIKRLDTSLGGFVTDIETIRSGTEQLLQRNSKLSAYAESGSGELDRFRALFAAYREHTESLIGAVEQLQQRNREAEAMLQHIEAVREHGEQLNARIAALLDGGGAAAG